MIKVSVLYPNTSGRQFDMDYYVNKHMAMSIQLLSTHPGFKGVSVDRGIGGGAPGSAASYIAMCHYLFDTFENFLAAFTPSSPILQGDMSNYTDIEATIQISEVVLAQ